MSKITTFFQEIGDERIQISLPENKVERIIDKVDALTFKGQFKQAKKILIPFIVTDTLLVSKQPDTRISISSEKKGAKKDIALKLINDLVSASKSRADIITTIKNELDMSYAQARHYVVNVAKVG